MGKVIPVSDEVWKILTHIKVAIGDKTYDEVLRVLLKDWRSKQDIAKVIQDLLR